MFTIHLIVLGKLKEEYWRSAEAEYLKRLKPFAKIVIHELKEEPFDEKSNAEVIKEKEAKKIKDQRSKIGDHHLIALDERGKQFSSTEFAKSFSNETMRQWDNVAFIIGGPLGLHESMLKEANLILSLSKLTFTHQMARVILMEQIYRAMMIIQGRKYHY